MIYILVHSDISPAYLTSSHKVYRPATPIEPDRIAGAD